jgi:DNA-binding response OmpR family regulator
MKKILLIEDDQKIAENVADILIISGYIVDIASDSDKGQESLFHYRADLIISDIVMPGMSGIELCQLVRKDPIRKRLPVVLLSGKTTERDVQLRPLMDGLELVRDIRRNSSLNDLPVIILSAKATPDDIKNGLDAGANEYLKKPCATEDLIEAINRCLPQ